MVRERTPEEIAEMERQRRIRMEQEAERWNMAPEDMPPDAGSPLDEESLNDMYDEDEEYIDEDGENDEDVIDLD
jgi:hypothetical protein